MNWYFIIIFQNNKNGKNKQPHYQITQMLHLNENGLLYKIL